MLLNADLYINVTSDF